MTASSSEWWSAGRFCSQMRFSATSALPQKSMFQQSKLLSAK